MTEHTIASYNMSFASDMGKIMGSEKHFILNGLTESREVGKNQRILWENAREFVYRFFTDSENVPNASACGLQEMNVRAKVAGVGGIEGVKERLPVSEFPDLDFFECVTTTPHGFPTVLTIWNKQKLGNKTHEHCGDLGEFPGYAALGPQHKGRPISIIHTDKQVTLVNLHAPNVPSDSLKGSPILRDAITATIDSCGFADRIDPKKLFIMGDFNDPYNAIRSSQPLVIGGMPLNHSLSDVKTLSCCYNFNSSCPDSLYNPTSEEVTRDFDGKMLTASPMECFINRNKENKDENEELSGNPKLMGDRGLLSNYKFTGDYVLGLDISAPLSIWRPVARSVSLESDHEMVMATFRIPVAGGRRGRKTQRKQNRRRSTQRKRRSSRR